MNLIFEQIRVGGDRNFGYLLGDREAKVGVLVDPSFTPEALVERAEAQELNITHIINTHGHGDHTNGNTKALELTGGQLAAFKEAASHPDLPLDDRATLTVGHFSLRFIHTPGHCPDHLVLIIEGENIALTGDLIFVGKVGGTGNDEDARTEWNSIQRILKELSDSTTLWPGHDYGCRPSSTVELEKKSNPFIRCATLKDFIQLKRDWPIFKAQHGLK